MNKSISYQPLSYEKPSKEELLKRSEAFLDLMKKRRTVREFSPEPVPDEVILNCIEAAGTAPSGAHLQPWHFVVVKNREIKKEIREAAEHEERINYEMRFSENMKQDIAMLETNFQKPFLEAAPVLIAVFKESYRIDDHQVRRKNYYVNESVGIATGLLITALHYAGLVALPHTPSPMRFLNKILNRPANETPVILFPVGYPKEDTTVPELHRKPLEEIVTRF
ncbi:nitroreductase family protein [Balneolaceae bacterium ANBcel3]|nr:nitroreductase family protein [Balneolaceae bacterium ANBcel3]